MKSVLVTAPEAEPVTTAQAKSHARYTTDDEDPQFVAWISAARQDCEDEQGAAYITQSWRLSLDAFPWSAAAIRLPRWPLLDVTTVKYFDADGDQQTWDASNYQVDSDAFPGQVAPAPGGSWPSTQVGKLNAVQIEYTAGYGDEAADVPENIKLPILLLVSYWEANRDAAEGGPGVRVIPFGVKHLLGRKRISGIQ